MAITDIAMSRQPNRQSGKKCTVESTSATQATATAAPLSLNDTLARVKSTDSYTTRTKRDTGADIVPKLHLSEQNISKTDMLTDTKQRARLLSRTSKKDTSPKCSSQSQGWSERQLPGPSRRALSPGQSPDSERFERLLRSLGAMPTPKNNKRTWTPTAEEQEKGWANYQRKVQEMNEYWSAIRRRQALEQHQIQQAAGSPNDAGQHDIPPEKCLSEIEKRRMRARSEGKGRIYLNTAIPIEEGKVQRQLARQRTNDLLQLKLTRATLGLPEVAAGEFLPSPLKLANIHWDDPRTISAYANRYLDFTSPQPAHRSHQTRHPMARGIQTKIKSKSTLRDEFKRKHSPKIPDIVEGTRGEGYQETERNGNGTQPLIHHRGELTECAEFDTTQEVHSPIYCLLPTCSQKYEPLCLPYWFTPECDHTFHEHCLRNAASTYVQRALHPMHFRCPHCRVKNSLVRTRQYAHTIGDALAFRYVYYFIEPDGSLIQSFRMSLHDPLTVHLPSEEDWSFDVMFHHNHPDLSPRKQQNFAERSKIAKEMMKERHFPKYYEDLGTETFDHQNNYARSIARPNNQDRVQDSASSTEKNQVRVSWYGVKTAPKRFVPFEHDNGITSSPSDRRNDQQAFVSAINYSPPRAITPWIGHYHYVKKTRKGFQEHRFGQSIIEFEVEDVQQAKVENFVSWLDRTEGNFDINDHDSIRQYTEIMEILRPRVKEHYAESQREVSSMTLALWYLWAQELGISPNIELITCFVRVVTEFCQRSRLWSQIDLQDFEMQAGEWLSGGDTEASKERLAEQAVLLDYVYDHVRLTVRITPDTQEPWFELKANDHGMTKHVQRYRAWKMQNTRN